MFPTMWGTDLGTSSISDLYGPTKAKLKKINLVSLCDRNCERWVCREASLQISVRVCLEHHKKKKRQNLRITFKKNNHLLKIRYGLINAVTCPSALKK